mmetsp:Transcript_6731/g.16255  ORF Transcript_6731/g.16255 Transcript_6731/m.16255 type:complete len:346 (-) Transcript_6731:538-1575(-)
MAHGYPMPHAQAHAQRNEPENTDAQGQPHVTPGGTVHPQRKPSLALAQAARAEIPPKQRPPRAVVLEPVALAPLDKDVAAPLAVPRLAEGEQQREAQPRVDKRVLAIRHLPLDGPAAAPRRHAPPAPRDLAGRDPPLGVPPGWQRVALAELDGAPRPKAQAPPRAAVRQNVLLPPLLERVGVAHPVPRLAVAGEGGEAEALVHDGVGALGPLPFQGAKRNTADAPPAPLQSLCRDLVRRPHRVPHGSRRAPGGGRRGPAAAHDQPLGLVGDGLGLHRQDRAVHTVRVPHGELPGDRRAAGRLPPEGAVHVLGLLPGVDVELVVGDEPPHNVRNVLGPAAVVVPAA